MDAKVLDAIGNSGPCAEIADFLSVTYIARSALIGIPVAEGSEAAMFRVIGLLRSHMLWTFVLTGLLCAPVPIHWLNGLETSCALATLTWTLAFATGNRFRDRLAAAFLAGVSASVRPDLLPFALILVLFMVVSRSQLQSKVVFW